MPTVREFPHLVAAELGRARAKHPGRINSVHLGYAVLLEELEEFWTEVKKQRAERDPRFLLAELTQVAAMAQRVAEDTGLLESGR